MKSIVVLISGNGSNLQALMDKISAGTVSGKIVSVISDQADAYGLERARQANIPVEILAFTGFASRSEYDHELLLLIEKYQPDVVMLAGFMRILSGFLVERFAGRMVNIHPSLLPKYKGLDTHQRALDAGDHEHGASVHFVTPALDDGPVIIQAKVPIFEDDSSDDLVVRVQEQERKI